MEILAFMHVQTLVRVTITWQKFFLADKAQPRNRSNVTRPSSP